MGKELFFEDLCYYADSVRQIHLLPTSNQVFLVIGDGIYVYDLEDMSELSSYGDRHSCYDKQEFAQLLENGTKLLTTPTTNHLWFFQWGEQGDDIYYIDQYYRSDTYQSLMRYNIDEDTTELVISADEIVGIYPDDGPYRLRFAVSPDEQYVAFYTEMYSEKIYVATINH